MGLHGGWVSLIGLRAGQQALIARLRGGHGLVGRLVALGFTPGAPLVMVRNDGWGPVLVALRGAQVALGRGEAAHILVHLEEV